MLLANKTALITGASKGIGRAVALAFAKEGAQVILLARSMDLLEKLKSEIDASAVSKAIIFQADVRKYDELKKVFDELNQNKIYIDVLVNNAGIMKDAVIQMVQQQLIHDIYETNVFGTISASQLAVKSMLKKRGGSIINLTSIVGVHGNLGQSVYASSKSAVIGFTKSLSKELASLNIRVNAVAPGFIDTEMTQSMDQRFHEKNIQSIGMKRIGTPDDVARTILFLASDLSAYVTGQVIGVDGGMII
ncbi:MAG: SDR family NAD(P)-dependent oxidoreductase [Bacteroidetes bacterium]|nr:SDR family NAD(P)-dependent oxidoreductase [Bacteroidota bacterium]